MKRQCLYVTVILPIKTAFCLLQNWSAMKLLFKNHHNNSISHLFLLIQPQPLLVKGYFLTNERLEKVMLVSHYNAPNFLEDLVLSILILYKLGFCNKKDQWNFKFIYSCTRTGTTIVRKLVLYHPKLYFNRICLLFIFIYLMSPPNMEEMKIWDKIYTQNSIWHNHPVPQQPQ